MFTKKNNRFLSPDRTLPLTILLLILVLGACVKQKIEVPPAFSEFTATAKSNTGNYFIIDDTASVFKIPVGISAVSNTDRVIQFSITSPSGAVAGQEYTLQHPGSITIPAGTVIDSIPVKGLYSAYATGRLDTLIFTLTGGDVTPSATAKSYTLTMQQYCNVVLNDLKGDYNNCYDTQTGSSPSGPYPITFSDIVATGPTTATATIVDFWGVGSTLTLNLDWTDPANFKTFIPQQLLYVDSYYGPITISPAGTGVFSSCSNTFTVAYSISASVGNFGDFLTYITR